MAFRKNLAILVLAAGLITGIAAIRFALAPKPDVLLRIGQVPVTRPEYMVYLYQQAETFERVGGPDIWDTDFNGEASEDIAKRNALNSLQLVKISVQKAREQGIALEPEDVAEAAESARQAYGDFPASFIEINSITPEIMNAVMEDNRLFARLYDHITRDYAISEDEFQAYAAEQSAEEEDWDALRERYADEKKREFFHRSYEQWATDVQTNVQEEEWLKISVRE